MWRKHNDSLNARASYLDGVSMSVLRRGSSQTSVAAQRTSLVSMNQRHHYVPQIPNHQVQTFVYEYCADILINLSTCATVL